MRTNSLGFYDTVSHTTEGAAGRRTPLIARIWKVFEALLQHCCKTDFVQVVQACVEEKNAYKKQVDEEYTSYKHTYAQDNESMEARLYDAEKKFTELNEGRIQAERAQV